MSHPQFVLSPLAVDVAPEAVGVRLPTPLDLDPWWDIYLPALHGDRGPALQAVDRALSGASEEQAGDVAAVAARALFTLGEGVEATRVAARAIGLGGREAERLAVFLAPRGRDRGLSLLRAGGSRGERADIACDLAARCLLEGEVGPALAAVATARAVCPEHREAAHWERFLRGEEACVTALRNARRRPRPSRERLLRDAELLAPLRSRGFVSEERLRRRLLGVSGAEPGAGTGALRQLADAGVQTLRFAFPHLARRAAPDAPLVVLELLADDVVTLGGEGRDPSRAVAELWAAAAAVDARLEGEVARFVIGVAVRDDRVAATGEEAVAVLRRSQPAEEATWDAALALVGRTRAPDRSVRLARRVLAGNPPSAAARMALDALRLCGHGEEARGAARRLTRRPDLVADAQRFLALDDAAPPGPVALGAAG